MMPHNSYAMERNQLHYSADYDEALQPNGDQFSRRPEAAAAAAAAAHATGRQPRLFSRHSMSNMNVGDGHYNAGFGYGRGQQAPMMYQQQSAYYTNPRVPPLVPGFMRPFANSSMDQYAAPPARQRQPEEQRAQFYAERAQNAAARQPNQAARQQHAAVRQQQQQQQLQTAARQPNPGARQPQLNPRQPDYLGAVLGVIQELNRDVTYPELICFLALRLRRPEMELKRQIPHVLLKAVHNGFLRKDSNRYSLVAEHEQQQIRERNKQAALRAKELEKVPLSWRMR